MEKPYAFGYEQLREMVCPLMLEAMVNEVHVALRRLLRAETRFVAVGVKELSSCDDRRSWLHYHVEYTFTFIYVKK